MLLLGFHGQKQSGKDTACAYLKEWATRRGLRVERRGFADLLKLSAARCFFPTIDLLDARDWADAIKYENVFSIPPDSHQISGREFLQHYGTEAHRDIFGEDFWVDALLPLGYSERGYPKWWNGFLRDSDVSAPDIAVVSDVRFINEAERMRACGGRVWEIVRPGDSADTHRSELPLSEDLVDGKLMNTSTLDEFRNTIFKLMDAHFDDYFGKVPGQATRL